MDQSLSIGMRQGYHLIDPSDINSKNSFQKFTLNSDMQKIQNMSQNLSANNNHRASNDDNNNRHNNIDAVSNSKFSISETTIERRVQGRNGDMNCSVQPVMSDPIRTIEELSTIAKTENFNPNQLSNEEIIRLMISRHVSQYKLESILGKSNAKRCTEIRREYFAKEIDDWDDVEDSNDNQTSPGSNHSTRANALMKSQTIEFAYDKVIGACCENVIGHVRLPVGLAGPLILDGRRYFVPLATTEGCLVASTSRGLSALAKCGGVTSMLFQDSMTRAPIVRFQDTHLKDALDNRNAAIDWLQDSENKEKIKNAFKSNSKHTRLMDYTIHPHGRELHIRFMAHTGDAMGMNMVSRGAEYALKELQKYFPSMDVVTLSGNMCTDKKPSAINWVLGRGKSVECQAVLSAEAVEQVLKVSVDDIIALHHDKVMIGSAMAGSIGGFNCHAANIVAAIYIATGQDVAHIVSSSNCMLTLEKDRRGSLEVICRMPSIECGTIGGGTHLPDQKSYLEILGLWGSTIQPSKSDCQHQGAPDDGNASKLARVVCASVMAAELSLLASLSQGTLVNSHLNLNRTTQPCKVV